MAPMTRSFSPGGVPGEHVRACYASRAAAGVGLIITEGVCVGRERAGPGDRVPRFYGEEQLSEWAKVADAVHAAGSVIVPQLWHVGMVRSQSGPPGTETAGAAWTRRSLDPAGAYAEAAAAAERIGFDGVELHGAHGCLLGPLPWAGPGRAASNVMAGVTFAAEIVAAVREAVSPGFPIIFRYPQLTPGTSGARLAETPQELEAVLHLLATAGVDAFHAAARRSWLPEFDGSDLTLAGWARKITGLPAIAAGPAGREGGYRRLFTGHAAEVGIDALIERLERGEFDLLTIGRALLQDPQWTAPTPEPAPAPAPAPNSWFGELPFRAAA